MMTMSSSGFWNKRPNIADVPEGYTYYTIDTMEAHLAQGGKWVLVGAGGAILASTAFKSPTTSTSGTATEIAGLATTFTGGNRPVEISFSSDFANSQVGGETTVTVSLNNSDIMVIRNTAAFSDKWETVSRSVVTKVTNGTLYTVRVKLARTVGTGVARLSGSNRESNQVIVRQG